MRALTGMRIRIKDSAPGAGPARNTYLDARLQRVVGPHTARINAVEFSLDYDGVFYEGNLALRRQGVAPLIFRSKGRRMANVLANLFEAAEERLGTMFPGRRVREEAS